MTTILYCCFHFNHHINFTRNLKFVLKGVVRSKIYGGVQYNSLKKWFLSHFGWPEKPSKASHQLRHRTINQSSRSNISTNRIRLCCSEKYEQAMPRAKQQRLCTRVKPLVIFYNRGNRFIFWFLRKREITLYFSEFCRDVLFSKHAKFSCLTRRFIGPILFGQKAMSFHGKFLTELPL